MDNWKELNSFAWNYYEKITDKKDLNDPLKWIKQSIELDNNYYNNDTYVALLYKSGRKKEALIAAENAIALGKKQGQDTTPTEELLEKIKKMK